MLGPVLAGVVCGCSGPSPALPPVTGPTTPRTSTAAPVSAPPANARFDYQIGGTYPPADGVGIVDRDRRERPAAGAYGICYLNAFQAQPDELGWWTANHPGLLLRDAAGRPVVDTDWDEVLLDLRTGPNRTELAGIVGSWLKGCAEAGYRGVELDNLDSWTRSAGLFGYPQARSYAALVVARAHAAGLAAAQKNAVEHSADLRASAGFDFAIVEECQVHDECDAVTEVYGDQVYEVEYPDDGAAAFEQACAARGSRISVILRDRGVVPRGGSGYTYRDC